MPSVPAPHRAVPGCGHTGKLLLGQCYCSKQSWPRAAGDGSGGRTDRRPASVPRAPATAQGLRPGGCRLGADGGRPAQVALPAPGSCPPAQGPSPWQGQSQALCASREPLELRRRGGGAAYHLLLLRSACSPAGKRADVSTTADGHEQDWKRTAPLLCTRSLSPHKQTPRTLGARALTGSGMLWRCLPAPGASARDQRASHPDGGGRRGASSAGRGAPNHRASAASSALRAAARSGGIQPGPKNVPGTLSLLLVFSIFSKATCMLFQ